MFNKADGGKDGKADQINGIEPVDSEVSSKTPSPTTLQQPPSTGSSSDSCITSGRSLLPHDSLQTAAVKDLSLFLTGTINGGGGNSNVSAAGSDPNLIRPTGNAEVDHRNLLASLENNPNVPRNCTITRPPPITKPGRYVGVQVKS